MRWFRRKQKRRSKGGGMWRTFGKKKYRHTYEYDKKAGAQKAAKANRQKYGRHARVVKEKGKWIVYTRDKK